MITSVQAISGNNTNFTGPFPFSMGKFLGALRDENHLTSKRKPRNFGLTLAMGTGVVAAPLNDLAIGTIALSIIQKTKMRSRKRPETLRETNANKTCTRSLENIEVSPFDHSVVLRDTRERKLMNNAQAFTS